MPQRITNGHRAAVCGLVIAGVSLGVACEIVNAPYKEMRAHLPTGWHTKTHHKKRWHSDLLAEVKEAWLDSAQKTATIGARYGVSGHNIIWLANREGWPKRRRGPAKKPNGNRSMTEAQRWRYEKMRPVIGADAARSLVFA